MWIGSWSARESDPRHLTEPWKGQSRSGSLVSSLKETIIQTAWVLCYWLKMPIANSTTPKPFTAIPINIPNSRASKLRATKKATRFQTERASKPCEKPCGHLHPSDDKQMPMVLPAWQHVLAVYRGSHVKGSEVGLARHQVARPNPSWISLNLDKPSRAADKQVEDLFLESHLCLVYTVSRQGCNATGLNSHINQPGMAHPSLDVQLLPAALRR